MIAHRAKMKYMDWLAQWLENYVRPSDKARTYEHYKRIAEQHIRGKIGGLALGALTPLVLQRFVTELLQSGNRKTGKGLSANSAKAVISVVQSSLRTANLLGLTAEYAADKLRRPKIAERRVECFTLDEQKKIESAVSESKKDKLYGILLCLYSGLRIGELIALRWSDIDFSKGVLTVSRSGRDGRGGRAARRKRRRSSGKASFRPAGRLRGDKKRRRPKSAPRSLARARGVWYNGKKGGGRHAGISLQRRVEVQAVGRRGVDARHPAARRDDRRGTVGRRGGRHEHGLVRGVRL